MLGVPIENEKNPNKGKIWVPYINEVKENWSYICDNHRMVSRQDDLVWRYEPAVDTLGGAS